MRQWHGFQKFIPKLKQSLIAPSDELLSYCDELTDQVYGKWAIQLCGMALSGGLSMQSSGSVFAKNRPDWGEVASDIPDTQRRDQILSRVVDIVGAGIILLAFLPLICVVSAIVYVSDPGPIFFAHKRIGEGGNLFRCFKFRTMAIDAEARLIALLDSSSEARDEWSRDHKLRADPRVVGIGRFLRRSSLDELPQLFNVLRGEMSLVGPRPIVQAEITRYGRYFSAYCSVRPGITGLWQISGRNDTSYRRRIAFDVAYSRSKSIALDLKILFFTLPSVLLAKGSY